jgi:hypothetical protein
MISKVGDSQNRRQAQQRGAPRDERERLIIGFWERFGPIPLARMNHLPRRSSGTTRRGFRWPPSMVRKLAGARVSSEFGWEQARKKVKQTRVLQWRQRLLIDVRERRRTSWCTASDGEAPPSCFPDREMEDDGSPRWVPLVRCIPIWYAGLGS